VAVDIPIRKVPHKSSDINLAFRGGRVSPIKANDTAMIPAAKKPVIIRKIHNTHKDPARAHPKVPIASPKTFFEADFLAKQQRITEPLRGFRKTLIY
jgi:hypothetical protein